jgi:hypothetical protein
MELEVFFPFELDICFQDFVLGFGCNEFAYKYVSAKSAVHAIVFRESYQDP